MKVLTSIIALSLLSAGFVIDAEAQLLKRLKKKAQQAAEQKLEQKATEQLQQMAEQMVEQSWSSVFGDLSTDSAAGGPIFLMNNNITTEEAYSFDTITRMEIEKIPQQGSSEPPVIMEMYFNPDQQYTGSRFYNDEMKQEKGELFIIYDIKNSAMIMLMANDKDKFSFAYDWNQALNVADSLQRKSEPTDWEETEAWQGYTKIGQKDILGYACDGYRSETENETVEIWITREAEFGMNNLFRAHTNAKQLRGQIPAEYPQGMIMEMTSEEIDSGDKTVMRVTDIRQNTNENFVMADYPRMSLPTKTAQN